MLLCVALVNFVPFFNDLTYFKVISNVPYAIRYVALGQGLSFLLYPLLGLLADLVFSRYKVIAAGSVMMSAGLFIINIIVFSYTLFNHNDAWFILLASAIVPLAVVVLSFGMVEGNALQFGMDQMLEASGEQLSRFVHWYVWVLWLGQFIFIAISGLSMLVIIHFLFLGYFKHSMRYMIAETAIVSNTLLVIASVVICIKKHSLNTANVSGNPLKNIFNVLKYARQHTIPENRSAFTYWEEDTPARIDLGKNKYGGPFTNEQVEDVKTFFSMLVLLLSLFGFHLTGDMFSLLQQLEVQQGCPSILALVLVLDNLAVPITLVVVLLPFYQTAVVQRALVFLRLNMIRRMWIGLLCSVLQTLCELALFRVNIQDWSSGPSLHFYIPTESLQSLDDWTGQNMSSRLPSMLFCYLLQIANQTLLHEAGIRYTVQNSVYFWLLIPQVLAGLSMLLVSMTALEFICAQAPQTLQGLLIGLWYAMYSIRYLLVAVLDTYITSSSSWYIYQGCKTSVILVSLLLYSLVARWYRYRERDEVVNVQQMIEAIHERNLDLEEVYEEEQQRLYGESDEDSSTDSSISESD